MSVGLRSLRSGVRTLRSPCSVIEEDTLSSPKVQPGAIARSVAVSLGNQEAPRSILASGTSFREDLVMKIFPLPLIQEEHLSVNGEKMCAKYWLPASGRLAQEQCG